MKNVGTILAVIALCIPTGYSVYLYNELADAKQQIVAVQLAKDSIEAVNDTTRMEQLRVLGDTITVYRRRAVQTEMRADSIDRALKSASAVRADLTAVVAGLNAQITSMLQRDSVGYSASIHKRILPYTVDINVLVPTRLDSIEVAMLIQLDTAKISARITCNSSGDIRSAELVVLPPNWLAVDIVNVTQDPSVCNPELVVPDVRRFYEKPLFVVSATTASIAILRQILTK